MPRRSPPTPTRNAPRERFSPLGLVKALFTHHVHLRREKRGLSFVLEPEPAAHSGAKADAPLHRDLRGLAMHAGLRAALGAHAAALAPLRECVADALAAQRQRPPEREIRQAPSSFFVDHKLQVNEVTPSEFVILTGDSRPAPALWVS